MKTLIFFFVLLQMSFSLGALKVVIFTDEVSGEKTEKMGASIRDNPIFKELGVQVLYSRVKSLPCKWKRDQVTPECEQQWALLSAQKVNADVVMMVWDQPKRGNVTVSMAGQTGMVTTAASPGAFTHELLHTLGFGDEYAYSSAQADAFCKPNRMHFINYAIFSDSPPYSSDQDARNRHRHQIPWYNLIKPSTYITSGNQLGSQQTNVIGLFRANTCKNSWPPLKVWKPGNEKTIMEDPAAPIPKYYKEFLQATLQMKKEGVEFGVWYKEETGTR